MNEDIIFWHRIHAGNFTTKLFDYFLHVVRQDMDDGNGWLVLWGTEKLSNEPMSMDGAFDYAEQFYKNEMTKRTDEPCL